MKIIILVIGNDILGEIEPIFMEFPTQILDKVGQRLVLGFVDFLEVYIYTHPMVLMTKFDYLVNEVGSLCKIV